MSSAHYHDELFIMHWHMLVRSRSIYLGEVGQTEMDLEFSILLIVSRIS